MGIKLTRNSTGRVSEWSTADLLDPVNQIHLLHDLLDRSSRLRADHPVVPMASLVVAGARAIEGLISEVRDILRSEMKGTFFRARPGSAEAPLTDFGPPSTQSRNRFNTDGQQTLYLSRISKVLEAELSQDGPIDGYWVQEFEVADGAGTLLPLSPVSVNRFVRLNQLMILAERKRSPEPLDPYVATNLLRDICDGEQVDAIEYPSVTGLFSSDPTAVNVAVTSPASIDIVLNSAAGAPYFVRSAPAAGR